MAGNLQVSPVPFRPDPYLYIKPEFIRSEYQEKTLLERRVHGPSKEDVNTTIWFTLVIIVISALIFITFIAWADVLRTWFEIKYGVREITPSITPGLYYAVVITIISLVILSFLGVCYLYTAHK